jgi:predicted DNA binding CopG/RHH family protein
MLYIADRMVDRERVLNVRMTEAEMAMVKDLADASGLSQSDIVRQLVRRAHAELDTKAKRKPKR